MYSYRFLLELAIGHHILNCAPQELVRLQPPSGLTCSAYLNAFISGVGGYVTNPNALSDCMYCAARTTDQFLFASFNVQYDHRWRNLGIVLAFCVLNVRC